MNINNNTVNRIHTNWQGVITNKQFGMHNWYGGHANRAAYWNGWANGVRTHWNYHGYHNIWFSHDWWERYPHPFGGWHYHWAFERHPWRYWWTVPTFVGLTDWFAWQAPIAVWQTPVIYDYGQGGNVTYVDNSVYIAGQKVASAEDFAMSAADLATVPAPKDVEEAKKSDWMALGTFAISASEKDQEPSRVIQLAVNKEGIIAGTMFNHETGKAYSVQGKVDKETQRVAFRIGDSENIVVETGLYNLTQDEAPILIHFGKDKVENYLLIRLEYKEEQQEDKLP